MCVNGYFSLGSSSHTIGMETASNSLAINIIDSFPNLEEFITDYIILPEKIDKKLQLKKFSLCTAITHRKFVYIFN